MLNSYRFLPRALLMGGLLCLLQIGFTWIFAPKEPVPATRYFRMFVVKDWDISPGRTALETGYKRFNNWDSLRFFEIAQNGLHIPAGTLDNSDVHEYRANITTPPAYPLAVNFV